MKFIAKKYDRIIFYSIPGVPWGTLSLSGDKALTVWSANYLPFDKVISVGFGDSYKNLLYMPRVWARINCYTTDSNDQKTLVKGLVGEFKFTGESLVTIN